MGYDEKLADRLRRAIGPRTDVSEKKMFGGIAFLLDGKMFCGIANQDLMVRVGPSAYEAALARPGARPMDFTGRPLVGYVYVAPDALRGAALRRWVDEALAFVATVKAKPARAKRKAAPAKARRGRA